MTLIEIIPIAWPLITAAASLAAHVIERRYPRAAALLRATGLDVPGAVRALRPPPVVPETSALRPSVPPPVAPEPEPAPKPKRARAVKR